MTTKPAGPRSRNKKATQPSGDDISEQLKKRDTPRRSRIVKASDELFKKALDTTAAMKEWLTSHFPEKWLKRMDLETLEPTKNTFLADCGLNRASDLICKVQIDGMPTYLILLVEHQSTVDHWMPLRLLIYAALILDAQIKHNRKQKQPRQPLIPVFPCVYYTGKKAWKGELDFFGLFGPQSNLAREIFNAPYLKFEPNIKVVEEGKGISLIELAFLWHQHNDPEDFIKRIFTLLCQVEDNHPDSWILGREEIVLDFLIQGPHKMDMELYKETVVSYLPIELQEKAMNLAQQFRQKGLMEGMQQGMLQGIQQGMQQGVQRREKEIALSMIADGESMEKIMRYTGLSKTQIESLYTLQ